MDTARNDWCMRGSVCSGTEGPGPAQQILRQYPGLFFVAAGLKYGPARSVLVAAACEHGLDKSPTLTPELLAGVLQTTVMKLHGMDYIDIWVHMPVSMRVLTLCVHAIPHRLRHTACPPDAQRRPWSQPS
jgi:hypothetical protein